MHYKQSVLLFTCHKRYSLNTNTACKSRVSIIRKLIWRGITEEKGRGGPTKEPSPNRKKKKKKKRKEKKKQIKKQKQIKTTRTKGMSSGSKFGKEMSFSLKEKNR